MASLRISVVIFGMLGYAFFAAADFTQSAWEFRARILPGSSMKQDYAVLDLPSEVFSYSKPDISDLRIVDADGEVPYVAAVERETSGVTYVSARMFDQSFVKGESTIFLVYLGSEGVFHNSFAIDTSSENFRRLVEVQGSNDKTNWRTLTPRGQIYDYTVRDIKPVTVRDTTVAYPDSTVRFLRVIIADQGEGPLAVTGIRVWRHISTAAREISYTPKLEVAENAELKSTEAVLDLGIRGIPHRRGRIATQSQNFNRLVSVYDSDDKANWRLLKNSYFFAVVAARFTGSNLDFVYPESNKRYIKLVIVNGDDRPIAVESAMLYGTVRRILFKFIPGNEYYLYLGNLKAHRPQYDIEKISQYVDTSTLDQVGAGPVVKNPGYVAPKPEKVPLAERSPYVLPVVLGAVIVLLAFLLLRLFLKMRTGSIPPAQS